MAKLKNVRQGASTYDPMDKETIQYKSWERYCALVIKLKTYGMSQGTISKWLVGKDNANMRTTISRKIRGRDKVSSALVTVTDVVHLEMLLLLAENGFNMCTPEFSECGELTFLDVISEEKGD